MTAFLVQRYQILFAGGARDTVNLNPPVMVYDLEGFRKGLRAKHPMAIGINITYQEQEIEN